MSDVQLYLVSIGVPAAAVFVVALLGNFLSFGNRFANALVTAVIVVAVLVAIALVRGGPIEIPMLAAAAAVIFIADLIANMIDFGNRTTSALVTAITFAVLYAAVIYVMGASA